ncbi:unnamed protein product [Arabidopsis halleri]
MQDFSPSCFYRSDGFRFHLVTYNIFAQVNEKYTFSQK